MSNDERIEIKLTDLILANTRFITTVTRQLKSGTDVAWVDAAHDEIQRAIFALYDAFYDKEAKQ